MGPRLRRLVVFAALVVAVAGLGMLAWRLAARRGRSESTRICDRSELDRALDEGRRAILANQRADGLFAYELSAPANPEQNDVRQLLSTKYFAQVARESPALAEAHRRNLEGVLAAWYREDDKAGHKLGYVAFGNASKLGANGLLLSALVTSPLYEAHAQQARHLADGILSLVHEDGSISPWYVVPNPPLSDEVWARYAVGEALLGLLDYYERTRDEHVLTEAARVQDYYLNHFVVAMERYYHPACVPWQVESLYRFHRLRPRPAYVEAAFVLSDKLLEMQNTRADQVDYVGRFYDPHRVDYGTPHSASDGVYTDGLTYAYELARQAGDAPRRLRYGRALKLAVANLLRLQGHAGDHFLPKSAWGALRTNVDDGTEYARIDNTQHTIDAWTRLLTFDDVALDYVAR